MRHRFILSIKMLLGKRNIPLPLVCVLYFVFLPCTAILAASGADEIRITLSADESLRQVSQRLLNDGDAWQIILRYNGIEHPDAASPGISLRIPVGLYTKLHRHLERVASLISQANREGAALLADKELAEAMRLQNQALRLKQEGRLQKAVKQATFAKAGALAALDKAKSTQIHTAEAWLVAKSGTVQNRPSGASRWQQTELEQRLQEQERVRTLADSRCRITFSDQSQLSLDEHALVVIGSMEKNVIRSSYSNSVSMIEGDILVHLASISQQKHFEVNLPNITTDVRSLNFLTSRDKKNVTRISNYDGEIDIRAGGGQVTVKKNQGTKIIPGHQPTTPKALLPPPEVLSPEPEQKLYGTEVLCTWKPIVGARQYQIEISSSAAFTDLLSSEKIKEQHFPWEAAAGGVYFLRIKTIDQDGCPGPYSEPLIFFIDPDNQPPFLMLHSLDKDIQIANEEIEIRGEVEKTALLRINGQEVKADDTGNFRYTVSLSNRKTVLKVEAVDPAGNVTTVERTVNRQQDNQLIQLDSLEKIISKTEEVAISGRLLPGARLQINKKPVQATEVFTHLLHLNEGEHTVDLEAIGPDGQRDTLRLQVVVDLHPPEIEVNNIEQATTVGQITLRGTVSEEGTVTLNGRAVRLLDRSFKEIIPLAEGSNELRLDAEDVAGNRSFWKETVLRDSQPPEILRKNVSPSTTKGGEVVRLSARIHDAGAGTARSGSFLLEVNGTLFKGILKRSGEDDSDFTGSVFVLSGVAGTVKMRKIWVQDMLGNTAEYSAEDVEGMRE
ncbi:MAG: FecR domain-containing protein [Candidatus Electrothrix communis]|nr:FecR domain-containing protein [Desulfobulbus sp. US4]WLE97225.1 MAG: FecR domain-containing protein [Candidatus Electrothrix communis]